MIRLNKSPKPAFLTNLLEADLIEKFEKTGESVWNFTDLKAALLLQSHGKCAYCECDLQTESKYLEVEHFECKKVYPTKVVNWDNLLPACKRCNGSKGEHDVNAEPIVNPFLVDPRDHLRFHLYRFDGKDSIGETTADVVDLNNYDRAILPRFEIGEAINKAVVLALERIQAYQGKATTARKNKLLGGVRELLLECQPKATYAATAATALHTFAAYARLRAELEILGLWLAEFEQLHVTSKSIAF